MVVVANLIKEFNYKAIRSSGKGGQHVNKVATKVELSFSVSASKALNNEQKHRILSKLANRLTNNGILILQCGESRSQLKNKTIITNRALSLIFDALKVSKKRVPTKKSQQAIKKRLKSKRLKSQIKATRKKPPID